MIISGKRIKLSKCKCLAEVESKRFQDISQEMDCFAITSLGYNITGTKFPSD